MLGGQVLPWHGLVLVHLDGTWVRADVALDGDLCRSRRYRVPTFVRGVGAPIPLEDALGRPHFRTLVELGAGADLPQAAYEGVMGLAPLHLPAWKDEVARRRASM